ncbi:MAG: hypothetical protein AB7S71_12325 [Dongiaceae bacterium]
MAKKNYSLDTLLSPVGNHPEANHGIVDPPVYRASTVLFPGVARFEAARNDRTAMVDGLTLFGTAPAGAAMRA